MTSKKHLSWARLLLAALRFSSSSAQTQIPADSILVHARIYTVNSAHPWAEALAIRDGKILAVGSSEQIRRLRGPSTKIIDAKGRLVLPGLTDCHVHFMEGSLLLQEIFLNGAQTIQEIQQRVKAYAIAHPNEPWLLGRGWNYPV
ncbi:MAG: amidohydrolase, partial [Acidobacteria bacterium]